MRGGFDGRAHQDPAVARIAVRGSRLEKERTTSKVLQTVHRPRAACRQERSLVAAVVADAGDVPHQLAQCHRPLFLRELGHELLNRIVEGQLILLEQQANRRGSERNGGGANPETRERLDGRTFFEVRPAKAFGPHDVATGADGDRHSRQVLLGEPGADNLPPPLHCIRPLRRGGRLRHGRHLLRVGVQGRCRRAHVGEQP